MQMIVMRYELGSELLLLLLEAIYGIPWFLFDSSWPLRSMNSVTKCVFVKKWDLYQLCTFLVVGHRGGGSGSKPANATHTPIRSVSLIN